ncbi:MAG TPA: hypothetical protein DDY68_03190 [Porphyromonadaceae bacterium]|nr:hypothetical protein [Porphyromonadaceae bacterium]
MMVGFDLEGNVVDYTILQHGETPGLGSKMKDWFRTEKKNQSILHSNPSKRRFYVSKDGGEVDAITAATISSRAFLEAIRRAHKQYITYLKDTKK